MIHELFYFYLFEKHTVCPKTKIKKTLSQHKKRKKMHTSIFIRKNGPSVVYNQRTINYLTCKTF